MASQQAKHHPCGLGLTHRLSGTQVCFLVIHVAPGAPAPSGTCCHRERLSQIRIDEMHFAILHLMHLNSSPTVANRSHSCLLPAQSCTRQFDDDHFQDEISLLEPQAVQYKIWVCRIMIYIFAGKAGVRANGRAAHQADPPVVQHSPQMKTIEWITTMTATATSYRNPPFESVKKRKGGFKPRCVGGNKNSWPK